MMITNKTIKKIIDRKTKDISNETLIETFSIFYITNGQLISLFKLKLSFYEP